MSRSVNFSLQPYLFFVIILFGFLEIAVGATSLQSKGGFVGVFGTIASWHTHLFPFAFEI